TLFRLINYLFSPVWVKRDDPQKRKGAMAEIKDKLESGENIIIFPEGTRGEPGEIQPFKTGIGRLAEEYHNIPIVPVFLHGPERVLPKRYFLPMPIWNNIFISPPQYFSDSSIEITKTLEKTINEISNTRQVLHHKRKKKSLNIPHTVTMLGIDGSVKSTISRILAEKLSLNSTSALISDKLEFYENGALRDMQPLVTEKVRGIIGRYAKQAKSLKMYKIPKLTELLLRDFLMDELRKWYSPDVIVLDGCPLLNLVSWTKLYREEEFNE
ncbi:MAG: 1-acyl-sn-glycerol-3-phosphate acyltransferase, partial [bacterium]|nr:1-acyl-sn-glycerol-3-phosphate acyltransferase [bacterium]